MNNKSTRSKVRGNVSSVFIIDFGQDDTFRLGTSECRFTEVTKKICTVISQELEAI